MDIKSLILGLQMGKGQGGSEGSDIQIKYAEGQFDGTGGSQTVTHNLGYIPDIVIATLGAIPGQGNLASCVCFSSAMLEALGGGYKNRVQFANAGGGSASLTSNKGIEIDQSGSIYASFGGIHAFTKTTFSIGSADVNVPSGASCRWIAISGIL